MSARNRSTARPRTGSSRARAKEGWQRARAGLCTCLFDEVHEPGPEAPGLVAVALQGADGHLGRSLGRHCHHVHGVVHQRRFRLQRHSPGLVPAPAPALGCSGEQQNPALHGDFRVLSALPGKLHHGERAQGSQAG